MSSLLNSQSTQMKEEKNYIVSPWHPQSVNEAEGPMYGGLAGCSGHSAKHVVEVMPESTMPGDLGTHIDFVLVVANEEVVHHACFMEIAEADHVFHPLDR